MSDCPWFVDTDPLGVDGEILYCVWPGGHDGDHALWGPTTAGLVWVLDADPLAEDYLALVAAIAQAVPLDEFHPDVLVLNEPAVAALRAAGCPPPESSRAHD